MASTTNQGQNTKEKVKDAATSVANQAGDMASKVASQASDMASKVVNKVGETAESATSSVGSSLQSAAGSLRENLPNKGMLGTATETVASTLESSGKYLEDKGLSGMSDDIAGVIKRYPIPAVLLALGLGYLIARSTRS